MAAERGHLLLDLPVVVAVGAARRQRRGAPEAEVHVDLAGPQRVQRPGCLAERGVPRSRSGHIQTGLMPTWPAKKRRNSAPRSTGISTSWMTYSRGGAPAPGVQRRGQAVPAVEGDQPAVGVRAAVPARPGAADHRVLHPERPRAPEPVGVPAPQVVADGEEVLLRAADRLVVDALPGVVAEPRRHVAERADGQVHLVEAERGAVHEVRPVPAQAAVPRDLRDRLHAGVRGRRSGSAAGARTARPARARW